MKKHLFYTLAVAALLGACSQDDFQVPANVGEESLNNDFAQYVGVPYEGEIGFSKGDDAQTRMVLDDDLAFQWQEGDEVGLVWMNSDAISYELSHYSYLNESKEIQDWIQKEYGLYSKYEEKVKSGEVIPRDDSYVWGLWPTNWKTFSNTRMTYDGTTWHMTDGQVYKGMYMAYFPLDESRQSTSKFTVTQNAEQAQNATTYTNAEDAKNTISNHILSTVPGEGLVWISENDGDVSTDGATQHSSFLYRLSEQNIESGKADKINIRMRPFSDILDLRINIHEGDMDAAVAKGIKIEKVTLMAQNAGASADKFPTKASFSMNAWGANQNPNGVYGTPSQLDGPYYYTWDVTAAGIANTGKYVPAEFKSEVTTKINKPAANNGVQQRVQMMLLPWNYANASAALGEDTKFVVRVNTNYGYIDLPEDEVWYYKKPGDSGLVVNPKDDPEAFGKVSDIKTKALAYALSYIGQRATRYVSFDASDLHYNDIDVCNTESLIEAITKWNQLGEKGGTFSVKQTEGCTFENLIWNNTSDNVVVKTQEMAAANQPDSEDIVLGAANEAIVTFLANGNTLKVEAYDGSVNLGGNSAIATGNIEFISSMTLEEGGKLGITTNVTLENGLNTETGSELYVSNEREASLTLGENSEAPTGSSIWYGDLYLYQAGNILLDRYTTVDNYGTMHINGHFLLNGAAKLNNNVDAASRAAGDVRLYAYAELNGSQTVGGISATQFNNNSTIHYVDMLRTEVGFWGSDPKLTYANNGTVIAKITQENQANHAAAYLNAANDFGATDLLIENANISKGEWNNLSALDSFERVTLTNATWNVFKAINLVNAVCWINGKVSIIGHNQEASFTIEQFILNNGSALTVNNIPVHETALTEMNNNTTLRGYDNFDKSTTQPIFNGNGKHSVYNSEGTLLFD